MILCDLWKPCQYFEPNTLKHWIPTTLKDLKITSSDDKNGKKNQQEKEDKSVDEKAIFDIHFYFYMAYFEIKKSAWAGREFFGRVFINPDINITINDFKWKYEDIITANKVFSVSYTRRDEVAQVLN